MVGGLDPGGGGGGLTLLLAKEIVLCITKAHVWLTLLLVNKGRSAK